MADPPRQPVGPPPQSDPTSAASPSLRPPAEPVPATPWGIGGTIAWSGIITSAFLVAAIASGMIYRRFLSPGEFTSDELMTSGDFFWINSFLALPAVAAVIAAAVLLRPGLPPAHYLALRPVPVRSFAVWTVILLLVQAALEIAFRLLGLGGMPPWMEAVGQNLACPVCFFLAIGVAAPLTEELVFRGFIFAGLRPRLGPHLAVLFSVAPWALLHAQYQPIYLLAVVALGLVLGYAREKSGSLLVPLALHSLNNFLAWAQLTYLQ